MSPGALRRKIGQEAREGLFRALPFLLRCPVTADTAAMISCQDGMALLSRQTASVSSENALIERHRSLVEWIDRRY
jgi:hypothetical protein